MNRESPQPSSEEEQVVAAARAGDHAAFSALSERYRRQLRVHCYRMLGSFDAAEDLVQDVLLRAWRSRESFEGRSSFRTWLYRIATNACLNALERTPRRVLPADVAPPVTAHTPASEARSRPPSASELPWLQPFPDALLETDDPSEGGPHAVLVRRESVGLAFLAALQHLPPRQRAMLLLCDVLGWSAKEASELLEGTLASVTSGVQRARATLRARLPEGGEAPLGTPSSEDEQRALRRFMAAWEHGDVAGLTELLREDARWGMPPAPLWFEGRAAIENLLRLYPPNWQGRSFKTIPTRANRQPAAAAYLRPAGESAYRFSGLHVLRVEGGQIAEITTFSPELCAGFELAPAL